MKGELILEKSTAIAIILCASVFIIIEVIKMFAKSIISSKQKCNIITLIPVPSNADDIEMIARKISLGEYCSEYSSDRIVFVDLGASSDTIDVCKRICKDKGFELKKPDDLPAIFKKSVCKSR